MKINIEKMIVAVLLASADDRGNMLRVYRRHLRDNYDPFHLPEARFIELFRLNKEAALKLLRELSPFMMEGVRITFVPKAVNWPLATRLCCFIISINFIF